MGKKKPGQVRHQVTLDEASEISEDLLAYAQKRRLKPGQANLCILADWSDAVRGRPNPFGIALTGIGGVTQEGANGSGTEQQEETPEQRKRREDERAASTQFM